MNIPEILPCRFCGNVPPPFNCKRGRVICGTEDCPIAGHSIEVEAWNRRQPTPEAADERERVYEDLATLLGRTDIQDEDGNHECRWCHDYVEAGSDEGFRHSRDCPFEAMKRAADYFAAHPPKPEPTAPAEGWIKCSDRLPEIGEEVQVYCIESVYPEKPRVKALARFIPYEEATTYYWDSAYGGGNRHTQQAVIAWQPLAAAPKS